MLRINLEQISKRKESWDQIYLWKVHRADRTNEWRAEEFKAIKGRDSTFVIEWTDWAAETSEPPVSVPVALD